MTVIPSLKNYLFDKKIDYTKFRISFLMQGYNKFMNTQIKDLSSYSQLLGEFELNADPSFSFFELSNEEKYIEESLLSMGFSVSQNQPKQNMESVDNLPRILSHHDWSRLGNGIKQRVQVLDQFIQDIYSNQHILKDRIISSHLIDSNPSFIKDCMNIKLPQNIWVRLYAPDIIRSSADEFCVLEDHLEVPLGISRMIKNRSRMQEKYSDMMEDLNVLDIQNHIQHIKSMLLKLSDGEKIAILGSEKDPFLQNEHQYLSKEMNVDLILPSELVFKNNSVYFKKENKLQKIHALYQHHDYRMLDYKVAKGLLNAFQKQCIQLANPPGVGIAETEMIYALIPQLCRYYLGEDPLLNNVDNNKPITDVSKAKIFNQHQIESRPVDLKTFVVFDRHIEVCPGGLTRVSSEPNMLITNARYQEHLKDTWVISA